MELRPKHEQFQPRQAAMEEKRKIGALAVARDYLDQLVSLAYRPETENTRQKVEEAIERMKANLEDHRASFDNLSLLADIARHHPERKEEIVPLISDSAEILLAEIQGFEGQVDDHTLNNIHVAWDALDAWDIARDPKSLSLCMNILNNLRGVAAADTLWKTVNRADRNNIPVRQAHDEILEGAA